MTGASGQTGVTGGWTPQSSHCARSNCMPWRCVISSSDRWLCQCVPSLAGASGFTGVTGATGQTGVIGGWTPQAAHCALSNHMPWRCLISTSDGQSSSQCAVACRRQRLHGGHGSHWSNGYHRWVDTPTIIYTLFWSYALEKSSSQLLGGNVEVCRHLQALAASPA